MEIDDLTTALKQNIEEKEKIIGRLIEDNITLAAMLKGMYEILQKHFDVQSGYVEKLISKYPR